MKPSVTAWWNKKDDMETWHICGLLTRTSHPKRLLKPSAPTPISSCPHKRKGTPNYPSSMSWLHTIPTPWGIPYTRNSPTHGNICTQIHTIHWHKISINATLSLWWAHADLQNMVRQLYFLRHGWSYNDTNRASRAISKTRTVCRENWDHSTGLIYKAGIQTIHQPLYKYTSDKNAGE